MQESTDVTGTLTAGRAATMRPVTLGLIVGNRDFFPDALIASARAELERLLSGLGIEAVILDEQTTKLGAVETYADASKCAALFRAHAEEIDGVLVALPNFGDEKAVVDTLRGSGLSVPILVQAEPDDLGRLDVASRRDSFCGKISVCNNLRQYGYPFSLTRRHTVSLADPRVPPGPRVVRGGLPRGARPAPGAPRRARRPARRVQHRPLQREDSRASRHLGRHRRSLVDLRRRATPAEPTIRPSRPRSPRSRGTPTRPGFPSRRCSSPRGSPSWSSAGARRTTSTRPPSSAGTRSRTTTASTPAP